MGGKDLDFNTALAKVCDPSTTLEVSDSFKTVFRKTAVAGALRDMCSDLSQHLETFVKNMPPDESYIYKKGWHDCRNEAIRYIDYAIMHWEDDNQAHEPSRMD